MQRLWCEWWVLQLKTIAVPLSWSTYMTKKLIWYNTTFMYRRELRGFASAHFNTHSPNPVYDCAWERKIILVFSALPQQLFWQSSAPRHSCEYWPKSKSPARSALGTSRKRSECWEFMTHKFNTFSCAPSSKYQCTTLESTRQCASVNLGSLLPEPHSNYWKAGLCQANTSK